MLVWGYKIRNLCIEWKPIEFFSCTNRIVLDSYRPSIAQIVWPRRNHIACLSQLHDRSHDQWLRFDPIDVRIGPDPRPHRIKRYKKSKFLCLNLTLSLKAPDLFLLTRIQKVMLWIDSNRSVLQWSRNLIWTSTSSRKPHDTLP